MLKIRRKKFTKLFKLMTFLILTFLIFYIIFISISKTHALKESARDLKSLLDEARLDTRNSDDFSQYGVYIDSSQNKAILFKGNEYSTFNTEKENIFSKKVYISDISLDTENQEVVFERPEGKTYNFGQIILSTSDDSKNIRVIIYPTGVVEILSS